MPPPAPTELDHPGPHVHTAADPSCCDVLYEHADGVARARGEALPWDKKLTLANSKFTACIFIFLILAPSASNRGSASLFSPLFLQPALFLFLFFSVLQLGPPATHGSGV